jgi:hypothetical protein
MEEIAANAVEIPGGNWQRLRAHQHAAGAPKDSHEPSDRPSRD